MANPYHDHNLALLAHLRGILLAMGEAEQVSEESHALFLERFDELIMNLQNVPEERHMGQDLICQVFHRYPQIAHLVPRDLLWFFGGDCLHFMPDEEIAVFHTIGGEFYALVNKCPHKQGPLSQGIVHGDSVSCPLHNWKISLKSGKALGDDEGCTPTIPLKVDAGRLYLLREAVMPRVGRAA